MKIQKKGRRAYAAKASALKRLLGAGMLLEGSLNMSMRGESEHWQLTDKADGKTRTLYVPARHAAEVTESIERWKQVRQAMKDLSAAALEHRKRVQGAEAQRLRTEAQVRQRHERQQDVVLPDADRVDALADVPAWIPAAPRVRVPQDDAGAVVRGDPHLHQALRVRHDDAPLQVILPRATLTLRRTRRSDSTSRDTGNRYDIRGGKGAV